MTVFRLLSVSERVDYFHLSILRYKESDFYTLCYHLSQNPTSSFQLMCTVLSASVSYMLTRMLKNKKRI